ncbi:MAG: tetratricopeptide repeat protein [Sandaracinaceae bacterium]|nr:tetratricopeptide repeat protein [Sandaracinaceae bacterium]
MRAALVAPCALALAGCIATISAPRSEAHVEAMREATRHYHHGRIEEAVAAWEAAARTADRRVDRDEADYRRAQAYRRLGRADEALALFDDLGDRAPLSRRTVRARFDAALLRLARGEDARAHEALEWIVRERPGDGPASRALRLLLAARSAEAQLDLVRELYPLVGRSDLGDDLLMHEARLLRDAGDLDGAVIVFERVTLEHPYPHGQRWDDALFELADLAEARGDPERAIEYLRQMIAPHTLTVIPGSQTLPSFPRAALRIARVYRDALDDPERAEAAYRALIAEFPTSLLRDDALYEIGAMWLDRGAPQRGCPILREVVERFEVGRPRRLARRRLEADCQMSSSSGGS